MWLYVTALTSARGLHIHTAHNEMASILCESLVRTENQLLYFHVYIHKMQKHVSTGCFMLLMSVVSKFC